MKSRETANFWEPRSACASVTYVKGCGVFGAGPDEIERAKQAAARADVAVEFVGEVNHWGQDTLSTNGEGRDAATLELTGRQEELLKAIHAAGKPVVVIIPR